MPFSPRTSLQSQSSHRTDPHSFNAAPPPIAPKPGATPDHPIFAAVEDDLRDAKRVGTHGQEEDLRAALGKTILRVEELSTLLRVAYRATTELETNLEVARSNLKLVQANNDMLEEALKRSDTKDVGWKRWSAQEGMRIEEERPKSLDESARGSGNASTASLPAPPPSSSPALDADAPAAVTVSSPVSPNPPAPTTVTESRFFRSFRFASSSGSSTPNARASRSPTRSFTSPMNSPSLPSLVPDKAKEQDAAEAARAKEREEREKKLAELTKELEKEKGERVKASDDKAALEAEIESLSQALFEEANKMVVHERMKRAETEDELREAQQEKDALRSALKLLEEENERLRIVEEDMDRRRTEGRRAIDLRSSEADEEESRRRSAIEIRDLDVVPHGAGPSRSGSSSAVGTKSPAFVPVSVPLEPEEQEQEQDVHLPLHSELGSDSHPTDKAPEETLNPGSTDAAGAQPGEAVSFFLSPPEPNFKPSTPGSYLAEEPSPWA